MSIPELSSRARLIEFLKGYFALKGSSDGSAPTDAQYITLATNGTLSRERVLRAGANVGLTDGGDGGALTIVASGSVDVSGTPSNNQIATFTDSDTIQGESNLTFNGSTLTVTGDISVSGECSADTLVVTSQPSFLVYLTSDQTISNDATYTTIQFTGEDYDTNNDFASYRFTAPVAGKYLFSANARIDSIPAKSTQWVQGKIRNITTGQEFSVGLVDLDDGADYHTVTGAVIMELAASDTVDFQVAIKDVDGSATNVFGQSTQDGFHRTYFSGYLLG